VNAATEPAAQSSISERRQSGRHGKEREGVGAMLPCGLRALEPSVRAVAVARNSTPASAIRALAARTGNVGNETDRNGRASTAAGAAIHPRCRAAADRPRRRKVHSYATPSTAVLLSAAPMK